MGRQNLNYQQGSGEVRLEAGKATTAPDTLLNTVESMCLDSLQTAPPLDEGVERPIPSLHCLLGEPYDPLPIPMPQLRYRVKLRGSSSWPGPCSWSPWTLTPSTTQPSSLKRRWPPSLFTSRSHLPRWVQETGFYSGHGLRGLFWRRGAWVMMG